MSFGQSECPNCGTSAALVAVETQGPAGAGRAQRIVDRCKSLALGLTGKSVLNPRIKEAAVGAGPGDKQRDYCAVRLCSGWPLTQHKKSRKTGGEKCLEHGHIRPEKQRV